MRNKFWKIFKIPLYLAATVSIIVSIIFCLITIEQNPMEFWNRDGNTDLLSIAIFLLNLFIRFFPVFFLTFGILHFFIKYVTKVMRY